MGVEFALAGVIVVSGDEGAEFVAEVAIGGVEAGHVLLDGLGVFALSRERGDGGPGGEIASDGLADLGDLAEVGVIDERGLVAVQRGGEFGQAGVVELFDAGFGGEFGGGEVLPEVAAEFKENGLDVTGVLQAGECSVDDIDQARLDSLEAVKGEEADGEEGHGRETT